MGQIRCASDPRRMGECALIQQGFRLYNGYWLSRMHHGVNGDPWWEACSRVRCGTCGVRPALKLQTADAETADARGGEVHCAEERYPEGCRLCGEGSRNRAPDWTLACDDCEHFGKGGIPVLCKWCLNSYKSRLMVEMRATVVRTARARVDPITEMACECKDIISRAFLEAERYNNLFCMTAEAGELGPGGKEEESVEVCCQASYYHEADVERRDAMQKCATLASEVDELVEQVVRLTLSLDGAGVQIARLKQEITRMRGEEGVED